MMNTLLFLLLLVLGVSGCHSSNQARDSRSSTLTQDAADVALNTKSSNFAIQIGAIGSNDSNTDTQITTGVVVCDQSAQRYLQANLKPGEESFYWPVASLKTPKTQTMRICSYGIMNGPVAQHIQITGGDTQASAAAVEICQPPHNAPGSYNPGVQLEYDLGPYESITRGSGIGAIITLLPGANYCIHRVPPKDLPNTIVGPIHVEVNYARF